MAYRFLGVKLLPGTHHLFLGTGRMFPGTPKLFLGTSWLLGTTQPFLGTLERFLGMLKFHRFLTLAPTNGRAWGDFTLSFTVSHSSLHRTRIRSHSAEPQELAATVIAITAAIAAAQLRLPSQQ
jgi:hypothetical protein